MKVKILTCYHLKSTLLKDGILTPIHAGRALLNPANPNAQWLLENTIGDDTGDNISEKNRSYNELTAIYWAWKNQDKLGYPDAIGFQHYRRHLVWNEELKLRPNGWTLGFKSFGEGTSEYLKNIGYSEQHVQSEAERFPCIVAFAQTKDSVYDQYKACKAFGHHIEDLDFIAAYIKSKFPEYEQAVNSYLTGKENYFANVFILRKDLFERYCAFIFDVLDAFDQQLDHESRTAWENRFFVSERVTGIFIRKLILDGIPTKKLHLSFVGSTSEFEFPRPSDSEDDVHIALPAGDNVLPELSVTLASINQEASPDRQYYVHLLHCGLTKEQQEALRNSFPASTNLHINFVDASPIIHKLNAALKGSSEPPSSEELKLLIQFIFSKIDKVLYLEPGVIAKADVGSLYFEKLDEKPIGAALDISKALQPWDAKAANCDRPGAVFQTSVLLLNLKQMQSLDLLKEAENLFQQGQRDVAEVFNIVFRNKIAQLSQRWNVNPQVALAYPDYRNRLLERFCIPYTQALEDPKIINFKPLLASLTTSGHENKWAFLWWRMARTTGYYEVLLLNALNRSRNRTSLFLTASAEIKFKLYSALSSITFKKIKKIEQKKEKYRKVRSQFIK